MKNSRIYVPDTDIVIILANGAGLKGIPILVDVAGFEKLDDMVAGSFYVNVSKRTVYSFYAKQKGKLRVIRSMHRLLTDCPDGSVFDHHPNHYGLDNRADNLTITTNDENLLNSHRFKDRPVLFEKLSDPDDLEAVKRDIVATQNFRVRK